MYDYSPATLIRELEMAFRLVAACGLAYIIGWDREAHRHPAGLRTHLLVALGACGFTLAGITLAGATFDPARVAAQVVTGVGFLGAGVIWKSPEERFVHGLTTAASLWIVASVGVLVGVGAYLPGAVTAVLSLAILRSRRGLSARSDRMQIPDRMRVDPYGESE
jgi:putative Mg2+ transporter-C (MgtC) family protein